MFLIIENIQISKNIINFSEYEHTFLLNIHLF